MASNRTGEVIRLHDEYGLSWDDATRVVRGRMLRRALARADSVDAMRPIVDQVIRDLYPDPERPV